MLTIILSLFWILFLASLFLKINSLRKIKILNHILALIFILVFYISIKNIFSWNTIDLLKVFHVWKLENYFLLMYSILWIAISFYSDFYFGEYFKHWKKLNSYYFNTLLFITSMFWVILSSEAITFLIFWEIMSLSSYLLVVHEQTKKWILKDWAWYLIITHIWMFFILLSFIPFIITTHSTIFSSWNWANLTTTLASLSFFSALIWFWSKAWLFPIHIWLPKAHPIAPTNISALMSWFMVKLPVFMILKFLLLFFAMKVQFSWFIVTILIASVSAFIWIFYALIQTNIKKMLAYSTIENIWIIFLWISIMILWMYTHKEIIIIIWLFATLYHSINHTIFKWLMFLLAWWIIERTWTYNYTQLWWLIKKTPFLAISFLIWIIAIAWIFPLNWFNSELLIYVGLMKSIFISSNFVSKIILIISIITLSATAILALITFTKTFWTIFLWNKRNTELKYIKIKSIWEKISYSVLILSIFILTIIPWFIYFITSNILNIKYTWTIFSFWNLNLNYIPAEFIGIILIFIFISYIIYKIFVKNERKSNVWNCWYNYIEPATQYTSQSFNQPIKRIFTNIYWIKKDNKQIKIDNANNKFKKNLEYINYDTVANYYTEFVYTKLLNIIQKIAKIVKSLQNWEIQSYIFYMFLAILLLVLYVLFI